MTTFQQYVENFGYTLDTNRKKLEWLMNNHNITLLGIDVYTSGNSEDSPILILRTEIKNPKPKTIRNNICFADNTKDENLVMSIPKDMISECIFKEYSDSLMESVIMLNNGIYYTMLIRY